MNHVDTVLFYVCPLSIIISNPKFEHIFPTMLNVIPMSNLDLVVLITTDEAHKQ